MLTRPGSTTLTVEVPPPRDAVLPVDVVLLPRDTALPLLLPELLEDRCSLVDVRLGSLVRLGRGGSGRLGVEGCETRVSGGAEREPVSPPDELEPELPDDPLELPELVGGGSVRLTARWANAQDGTAKLTATVMPRANVVDLAMTDSSKQALVQLYCQTVAPAIPCIPRTGLGECPLSLPSPADGTTMNPCVLRSEGSKVLRSASA